MGLASTPMFDDSADPNSRKNPSTSGLVLYHTKNSLSKYEFIDDSFKTQPVHQMPGEQHSLDLNVLVIVMITVVLGKRQ